MPDGSVPKQSSHFSEAAVAPREAGAADVAMAGMKISLAGRTALVTGGGSGLGRGFAQALAEAGARVVVAGRRATPLDETKALIESAGGTAHAIVCDVRSRDSVEAAVEEAVKWGEGVDILLNNAGAYPPMPFLATSEEQWLDVVETNLNGTFRVSQACGRHMAKSQWGRIISIVSPSAVMGFSFITAYSASKGGVAALTRSMASELAPLGITVNSLLMGFSQTDGIENTYGEAGLRALQSAIPLGRAAAAEDAAPMIVLLASDQGRYITGATIAVDGGMTAVVKIEGA